MFECLSVWHSFYIYACHVLVLLFKNGWYTVWSLHIYARKKVDLLHSNTDQKAKWPTIWFTKFFIVIIWCKKKNYFCSVIILLWLCYDLTLYITTSNLKNQRWVVSASMNQLSIPLFFFARNQTIHISINYNSMISVECIMY
jgi:hypothetical protein